MTFYIILEGLVSFFLLAGGIFAFIGSLGMANMRDFYMRLHGPTKATTLGVGCILVASMLYFSVTQSVVHIQELLITLFLFITAPVSAHLLAKSALHQKLKHDGKTQGRPKELYKELYQEEGGEKPVVHPDVGHV
ncbi:Na+/H+ antiporter subunit G [Pistricoccus aurantiacus]|uniref:Na+/H+ antiporter subunit G n=1 Tax=Pistricoccus aurantiacus TaxID=1883414 RepID=A0A5B8SWC2_9GAMM|nr:Na+/H+ antiporter subunit G [Pistricoccus aurantiacus]QEA39068.1 Na+/H+ antiporter subunit G [Pistricoccus aurantiacus]